jgi:hypothetical protein
MRFKILYFFILLIFFLPVAGCGYGSNYKGGMMTPPGATPAFTELVPNDTPAGSSDFTMTVNGSNLGTTATVYWNGAALSTSYVTGKQVMAAVPAANVAAAGTASVYVLSGSAKSNTLMFTVQ